MLRTLADRAEHFVVYAVSGEGRNEISGRYLSMMQFHLYNFAHVHAIDGEDVSWALECTQPVNHLLFKGLSRGIGYSYGNGMNRRSMIDATLERMEETKK